MDRRKDRFRWHHALAVRIVRPRRARDHYGAYSLLSRRILNAGGTTRRRGSSRDSSTRRTSESTSRDPDERDPDTDHEPAPCPHLIDARNEPSHDSCPLLLEAVRKPEGPRSPRRLRAQPRATPVIAGRIGYGVFSVPVFQLPHEPAACCFGESREGATSS
jgi:hypothetical protein